MRKLESLNIVGGNIKCFSCYGKGKHRIMWPCNSTTKYVPKRIENIHWNKYKHTQARSSPWYPDTTAKRYKQPICPQMDEWKGIRGNALIRYNRNGPLKCYTKGKKPDTEVHILYDFSYVKSLQYINPQNQNADWWLPEVGGVAWG